MPQYNLGPPLLDFTPIGQIGQQFAKFFKDRADKAEADDLIKQITGGATGAAPAAPSAPAEAGGFSPARFSAAGGLDQSREAIAKVESAGSGDYTAVGPPTKTGDRGIGRYQVMSFNVGPWTREVLGKAMTPDEFMRNPDAQDAVFNAKFSQFQKTTGTREGAASMWFTGKPLAEGANLKDVLGTSGSDYVNKFLGYGGGQKVTDTGAPPEAAPAAPVKVAQAAADTTGVNPAQLALIARLQQNPYTKSIGDALLAKYLTKADDTTTVGNRLVNKRTGAVIATYPETANRVIGNRLVSPEGKVVADFSDDKSIKPLITAEDRAQFGISPNDNRVYFLKGGEPHVLAQSNQHSAETDFVNQIKFEYEAKGEKLTTEQAIRKFNEAKKGGGEVSLNSDTLDSMAGQYMAGDKSVFQNLGRGAQGAANVVALRQRVQEKMKEQGISPEAQALKMQEFQGLAASQRTLGTRLANIGMAINEAKVLSPLVTDASDRVDRTQYPLLNKVILAAEQGTGDENVVRFGIAINSLVNAYARAINPSGASTVSDKEHARELLSTAWSKGQIKAGVDQLMKEMDAAQKAPGAVKEELRQLYTGEKKTEAALAAMDTKRGSPDWKATIFNARKAIRDGKVTPEAAKAWAKKNGFELSDADLAEQQ